VGALVGADAAGAVLLHAHAAEEAVALAPAASARGVVLLGQRPQRGLGVLDDRALALPALEHAGGRLVGVARGLREVDLHDVVRRPAGQAVALRRVDHVVGGRHQIGDGSDLSQVVVQGVQRLDVGHVGRAA
jgi:hypothetical protein